MLGVSSRVTLPVSAFRNRFLATDASVQVNTQLGEFTLRRHTMETLPRSIEEHPDFQSIFGLAEDSAR